MGEDCFGPTELLCAKLALSPGRSWNAYIYSKHLLRLSQGFGDTRKLEIVYFVSLGYETDYLLSSMCSVNIGFTRSEKPWTEK